MRPLQSRISICDLKVGETKICAETSISPQLLCASPRVSEPLGRVGLRQPSRACLGPSQHANSLPARSNRACLPVCAESTTQTAITMMFAAGATLVSGFNAGSMPARNAVAGRGAVTMQVSEALVAQPVALAKVRTA